VRARYGPDTIVAERAPSRAMLDLVRRAPSRAAVLVQGERHREGARRAAPPFLSDRVGNRSSQST
jgi:hypothetical protein